MEENKYDKVEEQNVVEKQENQFIQLDNTTVSKVKREEKKFIKNFVIGILGGLVGSIIIISLLLCVKPIRDKIFSNENEFKSEESNSLPTIELGDYENPVVAIAETVGPAVVGIKVEYEYASFFGTQKASQEGSGVIISSDGYILTNNHVVNADLSSSNTKAVINVYLPNSKEPLVATIQGKDAQTDIAIIKIDCTDLPFAQLGNSDDLKVGELVVAIGNPLGLEFAGSVSVGYVSALDRELSDSTGNTLKLIQTDAAINSGNSGGALVNSKGQVIGINTAKIQGTGVEGLGFAIPINDIKPIKDELIEKGKILRPYIGIGGINVDEDIAKKNNLVVGIYVRTIETFSAAERAGIKVGDVIVEIDGIKVTTMEELNEVKNKHKVGDKIKVVVNRQGKEETVEIVLQEQ